MKKTFMQRGTQYAKDIVSGKILSSKLTIAACQRQLDDLKRQGSPGFDYIFNPEITDKKGVKYRPAERICSFVQLLVHVKGEKAGQQFLIEDWQCFFLTTVFGWVHKDTFFRRFKELYAEIPRKNGKSPLGAAIGLYMLTMDMEPGAEVFSGAADRNQALEVFKPAWQQAKKSKALQDKFNLVIYGEKANFGSIVKSDDQSKFEPLVGSPGDGQSVHCAIIDEMHQHSSDDQYSCMKTGSIGRRQSLIAVITTAGVNTGGPCYLLRTQVVNILNKVEGFENEELFGLIYTLDDGLEWTDLTNWPRANPNWGVSVFPEKAEQILRDSLQKPSTQNITRTKHLNIWCSVASAFYDMVSLKKCVDESLIYQDFHGKSCITGVDLASKTDLTASIDVFWELIDGIRHYWAFTNAYLPENSLEGADNRHYQGWVIDGHLNTMPGASINTDVIEDDIKERAKNVDIIEIPHDPWNASTMVAHLEDDGFEMVEVGQTVANMTEPTKELESAILDGRFHYDGNPVMTWCLSNVVCEYDTNDNVKPKRAKNQNHMKIDCAIALIMAIGRAMVHKPRKSGNDGSLLNIPL